MGNLIKGHLVVFWVFFRLAMPTILALDVSLSMSRPVKTDGGSSDFTLKNLAVHGLSTLLDYFTAHCKLEFSSLVCMLRKSYY